MNLKIGEKIRELRLQHKMTQDQLADRLGVSYQSISRWENGITYPDIEFLPAIANYFSVSLDYLMGQDEVEKRKKIKKQINNIANMKEKNTEELIDLIRTCRREKESAEYFEDICYSLRYSILCKNSMVIDELRKSKDAFFEECDDTAIRSRALGYYASLEDESYIKALLDRYSSNQTTARDYLLKERYLFRDEFELFEYARQRYFHKQIAYLIDGDISLWRDSSKPMDAEYSVYENDAKMSLLHSICKEPIQNNFSITSKNVLDVFIEQRLYIGMRQLCAYVSLGKVEEAYSLLEEVVSLTEKISKMSDDEELSCVAPALDRLKMKVVKTPRNEKSECFISLFYILENGEKEWSVDIYPQTMIECLESANYARWGWLDHIRKEKRYIDLIDRLKAVVF